MSDLAPDSGTPSPEGSPDGPENLPSDASRASPKVEDTLPKALAFGVVAATLQMIVLLALLYC